MRSTSACWSSRAAGWGRSPPQRSHSPAERTIAGNRAPCALGTSRSRRIAPDSCRGRSSARRSRAARHARSGRDGPDRGRPTGILPLFGAGGRRRPWSVSSRRSSGTGSRAGGSRSSRSTGRRHRACSAGRSLLGLVATEVVLLQEVQLEDVVEPALQLISRPHQRLPISGENGLRLAATHDGRGPELAVDGDDRTEHRTDEGDYGDYDTGVHLDKRLTYTVSRTSPFAFIAYADTAAVQRRSAGVPCASWPSRGES